MRSKLSVTLSILTLVAAGLIASVVMAQNVGRLRFNKTYSFVTDEPIEVNAQVGPVLISSFEFKEVGLSTKRKLFKKKQDESIQTGILVAIQGENPTKDEWDVTFTIDLLDSNGKLIDRMRDSEEFEGEAKVHEFQHTTLAYVMPLIAKVEITLEAALD
jgi:hypothetical protein